MASADDASGAARASTKISSTSASASSFLPRDWGKKNIDAELGSLDPETPVLVEFYAHWCPTCQRFAPEFEKAARALLEKSSSSSDDSNFKIAVARVDCADEAATCVRFGVPHLPFIRFGSAAAFLAKQSPELETFDGARKGKAVAAWGELKARALIAKNGGGAGRGGGDVGALATQPPPPPPPPPPALKEEERKSRKEEDHAHEGPPPPPPPPPPPKKKEEEAAVNAPASGVGAPAVGGYAAFIGPAASAKESAPPPAGGGGLVVALGPAAAAAGGGAAKSEWGGPGPGWGVLSSGAGWAVWGRA